jgi:hypothetical protein
MRCVWSKRRIAVDVGHLIVVRIANSSLRCFDEMYGRFQDLIATCGETFDRGRYDNVGDRHPQLAGGTCAFRTGSFISQPGPVRLLPSLTPISPIPVRSNLGGEATRTLAANLAKIWHGEELAILQFRLPVQD